MIMRANTPRALGWPACLGLVALAALLLPLLPGRSQADPEPKKDVVIKKDVVVDRAELADEGDEGEEGRQELEKAEAELRKQLDELKARRAKLLQEARKKAAMAREKAHVEAQKAREAARERGKDKIKGKEGGKGATVIRVEVHGVNPDEAKDLAKKIESMLPGKDKRVIVLRGDRDGNAFRFWVQPRVPGRPGVPGIPPNPPTPPGAGPFGPGRGAGAERRIEALEKKLEGLMRELQQLRREMKRGPGQGTGEDTPGKGAGS